mmetsp:Transcript_41839/g.83976  ORF Transcript_41839/g.83976 Transcript_41839/m.83976 type:complete len:124 (+) Transcript_41839:707-1078(+)
MCQDRQLAMAYDLYAGCAVYNAPPHLLLSVAACETLSLDGSVPCVQRWYAEVRSCEHGRGYDVRTLSRERPFVARGETAIVQAEHLSCECQVVEAPRVFVISSGASRSASAALTLSYVTTHNI